ncbi:Gfo/Idh/MocA family oxidoreductase [Kribbella sp. NPDC050459]|uniref:Gfo/Idh/MocA family protein n=1 Tax=Kribbella sp. NPDC050459 TaxID=3155785 RepID=UPI0033FABC95
MSRYAVVGTGARAEMYVDALVGPYAGTTALVAWVEPNPARVRFYDEKISGVPNYSPDELEHAIKDCSVDTVIVTTPDQTHADIVQRALRAGADVIVEKPLTTSVDGARAIVDAIEETGRSLVLTFNYRYSQRNSALKEVLRSGRIGAVTSVHFEWALDTMHGADYFRRWHRVKTNSGGLLVHKSSHHFDLVNWWLEDSPAWVSARGRLAFYGERNAAGRGRPQRPPRGTVDPASDDPFALDLRGDDRLRRLYLEAEQYDGYQRDRDPFGPGITIEDNLAVLVEYDGGAMLTYSLNAHSPWEGYRVTINATEGRAELEVVERSAVLRDGEGRLILDASSVADDTADHDLRPRGQRLLVQPHWEAAELVELPEDTGGHGGGDELLLHDVFATPADDPLRRRADYRDGLRSIAVGLAANESITSGRSVRVDELGLPGWS